jgi:hypothetical protein
MRTALPTLFIAALASTASAQTLNELTPAEQRSGWILLFDGQSFNGWVDPNLKDPPAHAWEVADGCLKTVPHAATREDLMSARKFGDFEMLFDWKVAPGANSGMKYRIQALVFMDADKLRRGIPYEQQVEFEYQNHPSSRQGVRAGATKSTRWPLNTRSSTARGTPTPCVARATAPPRCTACRR